ncbi:MAG: rRNA maturation RNase YbeY [Candidatus Zixiibacteriota bacterium]|nr:MAG: rRNA maturation RNase YbeY [candidate division Zixibacteria bacterium]
MRLMIFKEVQGRIPSARLEKMFRKLSREERKPDWQGNINLIFTDDKSVRRLNREFRRVDAATDVLAFSIDYPDSTDSMFGEVYVSIPAAVRQAAESGVSVGERLLRLACHGLLHLFGYDHIKQRDVRQMKALEDYYVAYAGRSGRG